MTTTISTTDADCKHTSVFECASCSLQACINCNARVDQHHDLVKTIAAECAVCFANGDDWVGEVRDLRANRYHAVRLIGREDWKRVAEIDRRLRELGVEPGEPAAPGGKP